MSQKVDQLQNFQSTSVNGNASFVNLKAENFDVSKFNHDLKPETNGSVKTNGNSANILALHDQERFENNNYEKKYTIKSNEPPVQGSKLGRDESGNPAWFIEDPNQNGSFVKIKL